MPEDMFSHASIVIMCYCLLRRTKNSIKYFFFFSCTVNVIKFRMFLAKVFLIVQLLLKTLNAMANSVDPDQTAPSGAV